MNKTYFATLAILLAVSLVFSSCSNPNTDSSDTDSSSSSSSSPSSSSSSSSSSSPSSSSSSSSSSVPSSSKEESSSSVSAPSQSEESSLPTVLTQPDLPKDAAAEFPTGDPKEKNTKLSRLSNECRGWGQGRNLDKYNRPLGSISYAKKYGKYDALFIKPQTEEKFFYLTFDEGYENGYTAQILDTLQEKECKAVFFVTYDYAKRNAKLVQRMIDEGQIVGNHTMTHPSMPKISIEKATAEITKLHDYIQENFNYTMTLFRPPMGEFSDRTLALTQQLGYKSVFWSFAYKDWDPKNQMGTKTAYPIITKATHNGAIYLLHAVSKDNTEMLADFIDAVRKQGYTFSTEL